MVFFFSTIDRYPHRNSTASAAAAAASTVAVAVAVAEEGAFMVDCCLSFRFSLLV